ncbi:histidinol-phosphatase HisJ [Lactobacillus sp. Sy-1]|nr:histidinol-phosphatase HisJ [Lactobacillus sp. Sy-1]
MKVDGHTHTELCPHGSGDDTRKMIERSIELGFDEYHITEHAPMPDDFANAFAGFEENIDTEGIKKSQIDEYLKLATSLQTEYQNQIKISVGFEIEYLSGFEDETQKFLEEYEPATQNNILSVHYLRDRDGKYWGIDYSPAELANGFRFDIKDPQKLYQRYLQTVLASASFNWEHQKPLELGHISLIKKYQDYFHLPELFDADNLKIIDQIINKMKRNHLSLDFNSAGLYKKFCNDFYPGDQIIKRAVKNGIPVVFGSDAHSIDEVGHGWHLMNNLLKGLTCD